MSKVIHKSNQTKTAAMILDYLLVTIATRLGSKRTKRLGLAHSVLKSP